MKQTKEEKAKEMTLALRDFAEVMRKSYNPNKAYTEVLLRMCEKVFEEFGDTISSPFSLVEMKNGKILRRVTSAKVDWHKKSLYAYDNGIKLRVLSSGN